MRIRKKLAVIMVITMIIITNNVFADITAKASSVVYLNPFSLPTAKDNLKLENDINGLNDKINSLMGLIKLADETVDNNQEIPVNVPQGVTASNFEGAFLERNGNYVNSTINLQSNKLIIEKLDDLIPGAVYSLRIFTSNKNYFKNLKISDYLKFDNSNENIIRIPANPEKGFNYDYYLYIPKDIKNLSERRLLVEGNNSDPGTSQDFFDQNAYEIISNESPHTFGSKLQIPVMVPAFPRDFQYQEDYPYMQFINRGALTTQNTNEERADLQLAAMIKDAQNELRSNGIKVADKIFMTGYSSSGKFAERFTILHPDLVGAIAAGGVAGTTTLPLKEYNGSKLRFPVGIDDLKCLTGKDFDLAAYKQVPQYLYMGGLDTNDATEWRDCFEEQDAQTIWNLFGRKQIPDRWNKTQDVLKDFSEIHFATYNNLGHEMSNNTIDDVVNFFKSNWNYGLMGNSNDSDYTIPQTNQLAKEYTELNTVKTRLQGIKVGSGLQSWKKLNDSVCSNSDIKINLPFNLESDGFIGAILKDNSKIIEASYSVSKNNLQITLKNSLDNGTCVLKIYTCKGKYTINIKKSDTVIFNNSIENIIKIPANPGKGFNYDYYLYIPANIKNLPERRLLVEGDNSNPSSSQDIFNNNAYDTISNQSPHTFGSKLQIPVLVPAFPRDFHYDNQDDYTYMQFINRGALTTKDPKEKRADLQLAAMIKDAQNQLKSNGIKVADKIFMTGYSSSGKFAERFTILHPDLVRAIAAGGVAGTTTLPLNEYYGNKLRFPVGVDDLKELTGKDFDLASYKQVSQYLYMGELDTNDATEWRDCFEEQDAQTIWNLLGRKQMPDRWNKTQEVMKDFPEIKFTTYKGIGHEVNNETINDVVKFFTDTGLSVSNNQANTVSNPAVPVVNNDNFTVPQFSQGFSANKGSGQYSNSLNIKINRVNLDSTLRSFTYIGLSTNPSYTSDAADKILQIQASFNGKNNLVRYDDKLQYYASGISSCYIFLYDANKNPLGFAIVEDGSVVQLDGSLTNTESSDDKNYGNITQGNFVHQKDGWVYYISNCIMYKAKADDLSNKNRISDLEMSYPILIDDWIYFSGWNSSINGNLYKIKTDGTQQSLVLNASVRCLNYEDGWIYYIDCGSSIDTDLRGTINKIKIDGTGKTKISDDKANELIVSNGWVYYTSPTGPNNVALFRMKADGTNKEMLNDQYTNQLNVTTNYIFCCTGLNIGTGLVRMDLDGSNKKVIVKDSNVYNAFYINANENWIYFVDNGNSTKNQLCKIKPDGTGLTKVKGVTNLNSYFIIGDWVYYFSSADRYPPFYLHRVKMDGTQEIKLD
ncbi:MAG: DUF5050 domain-containing protein [Bacillota bacterium]|nr:DUF5050 domain-containing protein [Bacillota bacterium]